RARFSQQPVVQLANANGGAVAQAGVTVTAAVSTGGTLSAFTALTDADGKAAFTDLTLAGPVGNYVLTFAAAGLGSQTANVALTSGNAALVQMRDGNQQQAVAGTSVPVPPSVRVTDADGNPVAGATVLFDVSAGGGTVVGSPATTNASGDAQVTGWTLGNTGTNSLLAHLPGNAFGVTITATATQPPPVLTTLSVTLTPSTVVAGGQAQAFVAGRDQYGAAIATGAVIWASTGPASISSGGAIQAISAGQATIIATAGGKTGQATLNITAQPVLTTLIVALASPAIQVGATTQASVTGTDQFGANIAVGAVTWSATGSATVSASGLVTGTSVGTAIIRVASGALSAQANLTVTPGSTPTPVLTSLTVQITPTAIAVGGGAQAIVSGRDQFGVPIGTGLVVWSSTGGVTISQSGVIGGVSPGLATITATAGGVSAQGSIAVNAPTAPSLAAIFVTVSPVLIPVGGQAQATAIGRDQNGDVIALGAVTWSAPPGVTISPTGVITGVSLGQVQITATSGGKSGNGLVTVGDVPRLNEIFVTVSPTTIGVGGFSQATATGRDQYGNPFSPGPLAWYASPGASITQQGLIVGVSAGTVTISAQNTVNQKAGATNLTVTGTTPATRLLANGPPTGTVANRNPFPTQPVIQIVDASTGQPVAQAGVTVTASLTRGVGTLVGSTSAVTDATGRATFTNLAPAAQSGGSLMITFSAPGILSTTWTFNLTGGTVATDIVIAGGANQSVPSGRLVPAPVQVRVVDADGNGVTVPVSVTFAVTAGGGTITGATTTTSNGLATLGSWRLGAAGVNALAATAQGVSASVSIPANATPALVCAPPTTLVIGQQTFARLQPTGCTLFSIGNNGPFTGPFVDGIILYDHYVIDVPAGAAIRFDASYDFGGYVPFFQLHDAAGAFIASVRLNSPTPLTITNTTATTQRYQLLLLANPNSYGSTSFYSITPVRTN
ncbi:MAG: Ig-like domain-containing protein, partial [Phycisphaerae bacterium]|nr:Ig-like domain-containing protein [Gemmatimonadaceae bacterium]